MRSRSMSWSASSDSPTVSSPTRSPAQAPPSSPLATSGAALSASSLRNATARSSRVASTRASWTSVVTPHDHDRRSAPAAPIARAEPPHPRRTGPHQGRTAGHVRRSSIQGARRARHRRTHPRRRPTHPRRASRRPAMGHPAAAAGAARRGPPDERRGGGMSAPLIFLDTETTGLSLDDDIWEFAAIRREPDGTEATMHLFIVHDWEKCQFLPDRFRNEHERRFALHARDAISPGSAAFEISEFMEPAGDQKVHVVGAVPNFDTERIALLLRQFGYEPRWHYHLIDVETLAIGWLARRNGLMRPAEVPRPPWK